MLRQSDGMRQRHETGRIQSEQRLLQTGAYDQHVPFGVVESFHDRATEKEEASEGLVSAALARMTKRCLLAKFADRDPLAFLSPTRAPRIFQYHYGNVQKAAESSLIWKCARQSNISSGIYCFGFYLN